VVDDYLIFAGSASRKLGQDVAAHLGRPLGASETLRFSREPLRAACRRTCAAGTCSSSRARRSVNDNFVELLFWIDALKRASAASVTAVIPYFSYAKGDKKDEPRVSIRARVCATRSRRRGATAS
jgi:ribose-phosphate pyrophosphokinase